MRQRAAEVQRDYRGQLEALRADRDLSDEGKRTRITYLWRRTARETRELAAELEETRKSRRGELQRRAFSPTIPYHASEVERQTIQLNFRDAVDGAERARNADEAAALLERAERTGDVALARAIAGVAAERGFSSTLDAYLASRPDDAETIRELSELTPSVQETFGDRMRFSVARPPEVPANEPVETPAGTAA